MFAHVGIPDEVLSDQGTNFMLQDIYQTLLYGHLVSGPLDVLKEIRSEVGNATVASHVITMREHLQEMDIIKTNLTKAQKKQKLHYDEQVKPQNLQPGDKVLVLVPARCNKLQLEWGDHTKSPDRLPLLITKLKL